ncbi:fatty acid-binding protein, intestinal [Lates japonicus]|uniref:Fatty acid-binding protein, intestinal n=1 Tax=Lates japonicus TaxID=270547 RepID=A0AAD3N8P6_LATJO|nr:fatty acid-binding protein, intestinal [Lates japonicus]
MTFNGTWKIECNENYEKLRNDANVFDRINMVKRKLAAHDKPQDNHEQSGRQVGVKESSNFRTPDGSTRHCLMSYKLSTAAHPCTPAEHL